MKVLVLYYSMYGHVHRLAEAVAEGVAEVPGVMAGGARSHPRRRRPGRR